MKNQENITVYSENKTVYEFKKVHSPQSIKIVEDIEDPWFLYVIYYKTKTGIIADSSMIIFSDLESRVKHLKNVGWVQKK